MLFSVFKRPHRQARNRIRLALYVLCGVFILDCLRIATSHPPTKRISPTQHVPQERIFIAAIHRNTEFILVTNWNEALLNLTTYLGSNNVFVSIQESGSLDDTKGALRDLDFALKESGVRRSIKLGLTLQEQLDEVANAPKEEKEGWIRTNRG